MLTLFTIKRLISSELGLRAIGYAEDGLIEAVELENRDDRFILAIQWHPEMMSSKYDTQQSIIDRFIEACK